MEKSVRLCTGGSRRHPTRRSPVISLTLSLCLVYSAPVASQEWSEVFNPYTGQWEDLTPPTPDPADHQAQTVPTEAGVEGPRQSTDPASAAAEVLPPEPDYTTEEAALQILQHETDEATKWVYERPDCPSMHYHKPLRGKDVCSNPFGDDVAVSCPDGAKLMTDYHAAGSDACRSERSF